MHENHRCAGGAEPFGGPDGVGNHIAARARRERGIGDDALLEIDEDESRGLGIEHDEYLFEENFHKWMTEGSALCYARIDSQNR